MLKPNLALDGFKAPETMKPKMKNLGRFGCDDIKEIDARMAKIRESSRRIERKVCLQSCTVHKNSFILHAA